MTAPADTTGLDAAAARVAALVATAERRRQPGFCWQPGDRVLAAVTDTAGVDRVASLEVREAARLGCGCWRLTCDRPGPTPDGLVQFVTGCPTHEREV